MCCYRKFEELGIQDVRKIKTNTTKENLLYNQYPQKYGENTFSLEEVEFTVQIAYSCD